MCPPDVTTRTERPEETLAKLINRHLGIVTISPGEVSKLLLAKWHTIKVLAHAIHDSADDGWPKFTPKDEQERA